MSAISNTAQREGRRWDVFDACPSIVSISRYATLPLSEVTIRGKDVASRAPVVGIAPVRGVRIKVDLGYLGTT